METTPRNTEFNNIEPLSETVNQGEPDNVPSSMVSKNLIIIILASLLVLSFLGVNIFQSMIITIQNLVARILSIFGFYTGLLINSTADVVGDTAKGGVDIAEGTLHSIGNLLQNEDNMNGTPPAQMQWNTTLFNLNPTEKRDSGSQQAKPEVIIPPNIDSDLNKGTPKVPKYEPSDSTANNLTWCPVGYSNGSGKCIQTSTNEKCMYGKVFKTKDECEKDIDQVPFVGYASQGREINWGRPPPPPPPAALTPPYQPQMFNELPGQSCGKPPQFSNFGRVGQPIMYKPPAMTGPIQQQPNFYNPMSANMNTPPRQPSANMNTPPQQPSANMNTPPQQPNMNTNPPYIPPALPPVLPPTNINNPISTNPQSSTDYTPIIPQAPASESQYSTIDVAVLSSSAPIPSPMSPLPSVPPPTPVPSPAPFPPL